jgi:small multidrug resistance pump
MQGGIILGFLKGQRTQARFRNSVPALSHGFHSKVSVTGPGGCDLNRLSKTVGVLMSNYAFLVIAIVAEVIATSALKASEGFTQVLPSIIVVVGYVVAFYCLSMTLRTIPVGIAYAIWSGAGIVLVSLIGLVLYGQRLDFWAIVGIGFIITGVLIVNLLSRSAAH